MQIIPVIDLKNGLVVHARQGNRDQYAPLHSPLCPNADALELIHAFQEQFEFNAIYMADLNAITRQGDNYGLVSRMLSAFPNLEFWLDCGFPLPDWNAPDANNFTSVIGSESLTEENLQELTLLTRKFVLSLDFSNAGPMGAKSLFTNTACWPEKIIIMTLAKVGSNQGPALDWLKIYQQNHPDHTFIAAGGVRSIQDLNELKQVGIEHCLIASALHNGNLSAEDILSLQAKKCPG